MSTPPNDELDSLHHVAVHVSDLPKAIRWYQTSFRCTLVYEDKFQAVLQFANTRLQLVLPSMDPPHLGFMRADAKTLGELRLRPDGSRSTFLADSTGNVIEVLALPEESGKA
ncbi:MAG: VOC family protein [Bdellovibrionota bacterium]